MKYKQKVSGLGLNPQYRCQFQHVINDSMKPNVLTILIFDIKVTALAAAEYCFLLPTFSLTEEATQWTNASFGYFEFLEF